MGLDVHTVLEEIRGPLDLATWLECWAVYECSMIMAQAIIPPRVEAYARRMRNFAVKYPQ